MTICPPCHAQTDAPYARGRLVITPRGAGHFTVEVTRGADKWANRRATDGRPALSLRLSHELFAARVGVALFRRPRICARIAEIAMTPRELAGALRRQLNPRRARWQRPAALVRALRLRRGETVAEIGCGPGYFTARLARAVGPAGHVFAVDPEPAVLDIMRRRLRGVRNVTPVLGREDDPLLPRGRCRTAVLINVYHHMHGGTAFLRRLVASLPRDASVINVDWNETSEFGPPPRQRVPRTRFLRDARRAGLRLVTERTILPHQYFLVLRRAR